MMCVVDFVFALSQPQGVKWGWPGRREPDDEHSAECEKQQQQQQLPGFVGEGGKLPLQI